MSSRIAGNDRLGLGSSKIEVLAKNSKKKQGKLMIFLDFPACGVGFLTSSVLVGINNYRSRTIMGAQSRNIW